MKHIDLLRKLWGVSILFFMVFLPMKAKGQSVETKVLKVSKKRKLVLVKLPSKYAVGNMFTWKGSGCDALIKKRAKGKVLLSFQGCSQVGSMRKGMILNLKYLGSADTFKVFSFDEESGTIVTIIPGGVDVYEDDQFNVFAPDRKYCVADVVRVSGRKAYAKIEADCEIEYEIRKGLDMDLLAERKRKKPNKKASVYPRPKSKKKKRRRKKKNQYRESLNDYYLFSSFGFFNVSYSNAQDKSNQETLSNNEEASKLAIFSDILGAYVAHDEWPLLWGAVFRMEREAYTTSSFTFEVYQYSIAASSYYFFDQKEFPTGIFLRGDLGFARLQSTGITNTTTGQVETDPEATGLSLLAGIGYSIAVGESQDNFLMFQGNFATRKTGDRGSSVLSLSVGLMW